MPIGTIISTMGDRFISDEMVENDSASIDCSMLTDAGPIWYKSDMNQNRLANCRN